uniref:tRNA-binding domain-containing protein n=1 Tax=Strigamia maritima TaxID=126957 RepID=T1IWR1_STRMM
MEVTDVLHRLETRASKASEIIELLDQQIREAKKAAIAQNTLSEEIRLREENALLRAEIEVWKQRLIKAECKNGVKQYHNFCMRTNEPKHTKVSHMSQQIFEKQGKLKESKKANEKHDADNKSTKSGPSDERQVDNKSIKSDSKSIKSDNKSIKSDNKSIKSDNKSIKSDYKSTKSGPSDERQADVSRLDFRVGKIISAKKHPDADSLYVEEVDLGEGKMRTVVSGLVRFVPLEAMQNRAVVLLCNLKPAKMRGVLSEAMVMCASTSEKVEILIPPSAAVPGDRVICEEFLGDPDKELNPKKKIFEQVAPDLKTDEEKRATYKGKLLVIPGKGNIVAESLINVQIK